MKLLGKLGKIKIYKGKFTDILSCMICVVESKTSLKFLCFDDNGRIYCDTTSVKFLKEEDYEKKRVFRKCSNHRKQKMLY